jgi:hypothetical protein
VAVLLVVELDGGAQVVEAGVQGGDLAVVGGGRKLRIAMAARTPRITTTINSSTSVKPRGGGGGESSLLTPVMD